MERPRIFLVSKATNSTEYVDVLSVPLSADAKGVSYFALAINPDAKALYQIIITKILSENDLPLAAVTLIELPHLTSGVYEGFRAGDTIQIRQKSTDGTTVTTGVSLQMSEVVEERKVPCPEAR